MSSASFDEAAVAELLDEVLTAHTEYYCHDDDDGPAVDAAGARLAEAVEKMFALGATASAACLAKLAYACVHSSQLMFDSTLPPPLDFAAVAGSSTDPQKRLIAQAIVALEEACTDSPVATVIEKHRRLARERAERDATDPEAALPPGLAPTLARRRDRRGRLMGSTRDF